jgi:hypothetical protein
VVTALSPLPNKLGPKIADLAKAMTAYNPDKTWKVSYSESDEQ